MNFTSFSQNTQKGKESICKQTLGKIRKFTDIPLICTKHPGKSSGHAMRSLGLGAARIAGFRRGRRRGWPGRRWRRV
jgi:hypothetical protein